MFSKIKTFFVSTASKAGVLTAITVASAYNASAAMATSSITDMATDMAQGIWDLVLEVYPAVFIALLPLIALYKVYGWASSKF